MRQVAGGAAGLPPIDNPACAGWRAARPASTPQSIILCRGGSAWGQQRALLYVECPELGQPIGLEVKGVVERPQGALAYAVGPRVG